MSWWINATYDERGYGDIVVCHPNDEGLKFRFRTGSINGHLQLVNACPPGAWAIKEPPVRTSEAGMVVDGYGRKVRLYSRLQDGTYAYTHILVHPDGGKAVGNGTDGCLGLLSNFKEFFAFVELILASQPMIEVAITREIGKHGAV